MKQRPFQQVDVFTKKPYFGNPLAVVMDCGDLSTAQMQLFAQWTNLSETAFLLPPSELGLAAGAHYQVRIFTPKVELPFAGHPTLGCCHAWIEEQRSSLGSSFTQPAEIIQECARGIVKIKHIEGRWSFAAPSLAQSTPDNKDIADVLNALDLLKTDVIDSQWLDNGPRWFTLWLTHPDVVLGIKPNHNLLSDLKIKVGVASAYPLTNHKLISRSNREARAFNAPSQRHSFDGSLMQHIEVRAFAAALGIPEDPVTGSLNASIAQWLIPKGTLSTTYIAHQGSRIYRDGLIFLSADAQSQVWVGGDSVTCIRGSVFI